VVAAACCVVDASGFLLINEYLQSAGGPPEVFAVGDVASSVTDPRPKAGVYAVRQVRAAVLFCANGSYGLAGSNLCCLHWVMRRRT
jgi:NADH dehydrogenase FAD-containing subunit